MHGTSMNLKPPISHHFVLPPKLPQFSILARSNRHEAFPQSSEPPSPRNLSWRAKKKRSTHLMASRRELPFEVLGVSPSSTPQEIKRAYRKLALKYHPDVNKEANAQEKFMRIKHAYNTLLNSESQSKYGFNDHSSNYSRTSSGRNKNQTSQDEAFYGFADFFRDLQAEVQNWESGINSQEKPKSLWEELADIGEEFVEFLEKELNIDDSKSEVEGGSNPYTNTNVGKEKAGVKDEGNKDIGIDESIDEIEAALAQLKKELGL